ncbi:MAG TPA: hypothetical protein ENK68_04665 [Epsilonproteobacteria bacterium]|nr:hypothetical protein [Campylobacterota bacterium]
MQSDFPRVMQGTMIQMWASKLGLAKFDTALFNDMMKLMIETSVDYTIFFRELSNVPEDIAPIAKSFYGESVLNDKLMQQWTEWFGRWKALVNVKTKEEIEALSKKMKSVNPKYALREWFLVPTYKHATHGDYDLVHQLQEIMNKPYEEQSEEVENLFYREKPAELFDIAGVSHVTCSS